MSASLSFNPDLKHAWQQGFTQQFPAAKQTQRMRL
jgi:hypothetical protein